MNTPGIGITFERKSVSRAPFPCFKQSMRKQRQRSRFIADIPQDQIHQPRFKLPVTAFGWFFDGAAQLSAVIGPMYS